MATIIKHRRLASDAWRVLEGNPKRWLQPADDGLLPDLPPGDLIVPLAVWRARADDLDERPRRGVLLPADADPAAIASDLTRVDLVAVEIASSSDGRAYSIARLLRERHGFRGELRAVGHVARDQLADLERCGFDAFAPSDGTDPAAALASFTMIGAAYQPDARSPRGRRLVAA